MIPRQSYLLSVVLLILGFPLYAYDEPLDINGFLGLKRVDASGPASWLTGGPGKFLSDDRRDGSVIGDLQVGLTWRPNLYFKAHVHAIGQMEEDASEDLNDAGVAEAFFQISALGSQQRFTTKVGIFFPPTSMENTDPLWSSPHTQNFSVLNSWIGEEMRLSGVELGYQADLGEDKTLFSGGTTFWGNDASGSLLFWRGWALGHRISTWREAVPLPNLASLQDGGPFEAQQQEGVTAYGSDLDGKPGFMGHVGFEWVGRMVVQASYLDNHGDRLLHGSEYAWRTRFFSAGAEVFLGEHLSVIGEFMDGSTGMGIRTDPHAQADVLTWYVMASMEISPAFRVASRYDDFESVDLDRFVAPLNADLNDEQGNAVTVSLFWFPLERLRLGVEYIELANHRPTILVDQKIDVRGGESLNLEIRYTFP